MLRARNGPDVNSHVAFTYRDYWDDLGLDMPEGLEFTKGVMGRGVAGCICKKDYDCRSLVVKPGRFESDGAGVIRFLLHELGHNMGKFENSLETRKVKSVVGTNLSVFSYTGMRHNWDHKPADIPGMLPGFCYQGELQGNLIMSRSSDDWQINPLIWSPCQRCDFLGTYYDVIDRDGDFCLSDDSNTFTSIAGKSKHQDSTFCLL